MKKFSLENSESRIANTKRNMIVGYVLLIFSYICNFVYRIVFIKLLSIEYLGIASALTGVTAILSLTEMGLGSAIVYFLYKPLGVERDEVKVASIIQLLKKIYMVMAAITLIIGLAMLPLLRFFIKEELNVTPNIRIAYLFYVFGAIFAYVGTNKAVLFLADQKDFVLKINYYGGKILSQILIMIFLAFTKSYWVVLIAENLVVVFQNILITLYANKKYPFIKTKAPPISKEEKKEMVKLTGSFFINKVGSVVLNSTDTLIISGVLGVVLSGVYSNYYFVIAAINAVISIAFSAVIGSLGNFIMTQDKENSYSLYRTFNLAASWIAAFSAIGLCLVSDSFIKVWLGSDFVLEPTVILFMSLAFFLENMARSNEAFILPMGLTNKTVIWGIVYVILNIVFSIVFVYRMGMAGVFLGTIIARSVSLCASTLIVNKLGFHKKIRFFLRDISYYVLIAAVAFIVSYFSTDFSLKSNALDFITKFLIVTVIVNVLFFASTFWSRPFRKILSFVNRRKL